jgi:hypothetical protein
VDHVAEAQHEPAKAGSASFHRLAATAFAKTVHSALAAYHRGEGQGRMNLKLVSFSNDRALDIRDHLVPLVRDRRRLELQRGSVRLISLQTGPWAFAPGTPFNALAPGRHPHRDIATPWSGSTRGRACPMGSRYGTTG